MINDAHSLELYMMAVSLVEGKGTLITIGVTTLREYRSLSITSLVPATSMCGRGARFFRSLVSKMG